MEKKNKPGRFLRRTLRVIGGLLLIHMLALALMYFFQEKLIFHPPAALAKDYKFSYTAPFEEIDIPVSGGVSFEAVSTMLASLLVHRGQPRRRMTVPPA